MSEQSDQIAIEEPAAWQWRYVGEERWRTPSGGRKIDPKVLAREFPIEQRPLYPAPAVSREALIALLTEKLSIENTKDEYAELHGIDESADAILALFRAPRSAGQP